jgi:hypothetical protein
VSFPRSTERALDHLLRLLGDLVAFGALAVSTYALAFAVSLLPAGGWIRDAVFGEASASCYPAWVRVPQVVPALASVGLCSLALYRFVRPATSPQARKTWLLLVAGVCMLAGWVATMDLADCGIGSDE